LLAINYVNNALQSSAAMTRPSTSR